LPLCSQHLPAEVREVLREMPLDPTCLEEVPYQTKIEVYDTKCSGCGFARVILMNRRKGVGRFNIIAKSNDVKEILCRAKNLMMLKRYYVELKILMILLSVVVLILMMSVILMIILFTLR